ncbi:N-acetyltransferase [Phaeobacter sp. HF9A]|uniref:GNAT family N-acetyltransferase n=1 Tax=Phaeobacter sp. HF9A TaxID=2721561 RepID=UPI00142F5890|nr:GNAT family N-acetyltransferase [Phaeobacter sp. HF9A]NIZ14172.1 GNAT family N-acetyltransferase [Phaeobacter sp. HF9A]
MDLTPRRLRPDSPELALALDLIRRCFSEMDGRIDPPSSMHRLTIADLAAQAVAGEVWCLGPAPGGPLRACVVLTPRPDALYLGKLAVDPATRGQGLARQLVDLAAARARASALPALELQVRVELLENHATFARLGFVKTGETTHPGYDRATSWTMRRQV